jgi:hypothetical protein
MGQPHPTLTLILDIDKRLDSPHVQQEIRRDYAYVGSTLIRTHEAASEDAPIENTMHLVLKLGRRQYLYSKDEGSDELWNDFLEHWFYNAFFKLGNHMKIYNRRQREIGMPELVFDWIELELQNGKLRVRMHTDSNSDILPDTSTWLTAIRTALNAGALGENCGAEIEQITLPSPEFYEKQLEEGLKAQEEKRAQEEAQRLAQEEAEAAAKAQQEAEAEEAFLESPQLVQEAVEAAEAAEAEAAAGAEAAGDEGARDGDGAGEGAGAAAEDGADAEEAGAAGAAGEETEEPVQHVSDFNHEAYKTDADYSFAEPLFALDYSVWTIEYLDGSARIFDSKENSFID